MATKPTQYIAWTDGAANKVQKPPTAKQLLGWVAGEPPAAQYINWLFYTLDQWIQWLDQISALAGGTGNSTALDNARLINGGTWSWNLASSQLTWSAPFNIPMPGQNDADNQAAANTITLADGAIASVEANIPITTNGDTTNGSQQVVNVAYNNGIAVGNNVSGPGIPSGTMVTGISGTSITLSQAATATAQQVLLVFDTSGALSVTVVQESMASPTGKTLVFARRVGATVLLGVSAGDTLLRDGEAKPLRGVGYGPLISAVAGEAITAGQAVYIASAADTGRTAGQAYRTDASAANGALRGQVFGIALASAASGAAVVLVTSGVLGGQSGLLVGTQYYADPATLGGRIAGPLAGQGVYASPIGVAISATQLLLDCGQPQTVTVTNTAQGTVGVSTDAQLAGAITSAGTNGGAVIVLQAPITLTASRTLPANTILIGKGTQTVLSAPNFTLTLSDNCVMQDVNMLGSTSGASPLVAASGNYAVVNRCVLNASASQSSTNTCVAVSGIGNRLSQNSYQNVLNTNNTGVAFNGGSDNSDSFSVFT